MDDKISRGSRSKFTDSFTTGKFVFERLILSYSASGSIYPLSPNTSYGPVNYSTWIVVPFPFNLREGIPLISFEILSSSSGSIR